MKRKITINERNKIEGNILLHAVLYHLCIIAVSNEKYVLNFCQWKWLNESIEFTFS